uniref:KIB1-4 beta-propeller domain-containing protein n=1 Tax=Oryza glumipatula TaxID=40148 RepID=A0A0E0AKT9_9ORYZ
MGSDWSTLTGCLVMLIAERLLANDVTDYIRFRAVCSPWRQHTEDPRVGDGLRPKYLPRSWIMLEETPPAAAPFRNRLLNTDTGAVLAVDVPELEDHDVMGPTLGGLLTLRERGGAHVLRLLHPFTRHLTELPSLVTMIHAASHDPKMVEPEYHQPTAIGLSDDHKAVAVFCGLVNKVAVARPGDSHWKWVYVPHFHLESAASLAGCFYAVSHVYIYQLESDGARGEPKLVPVAYVPVDAPSFRLTLVADDERETLMLMKEVFYVHAGEEVPPEGPDMLTMPRVCVAYAVDMAARTIALSRLGARALFMGDDRAVWASPGAFSPGVAADTVYAGRPNRLFTVHECGIEADRPLTVVLHTHGLVSGLTRHAVFESDDGEDLNPMGIVETVSSYVASDRGGAARPTMYVASHARRGRGRGV